MHKRYVVALTNEERASLTGVIAAGTARARRPTHARILKADAWPHGPGWVDERITEAVEVSQPTMAPVRRQYVEAGLEAALNRRAPRPPAPPRAFDARSGYTSRISPRDLADKPARVGDHREDGAGASDVSETGGNSCREPAHSGS